MSKRLLLAGCVIIAATISITHIPFTIEPISAPKVEYAGDTLMRRGLTLYARDSLEEAALVLRRALTFYPDFSLLHFYLAEVSRRQGDVQTAEKEYAHAIEIDRELYPAYHQLALLRHAEGAHASAIQLLETTIILNPYDREAYQTLATIYIDIGNFAAADQVYQRQRAVEEHTVE